MSTFTWKCPKCGHENVVSVAAGVNSGIFTRVCNPDNGGCDELVVVQSRSVTTWEVKVFELVEVKE